MCSSVPFVRLWLMLSVWCLLGRDIRERRVAGSIERPHTIAITSIGREPSIRKARDIGADLRYLRKICAILTSTALDAEALLIS